MAYFIEYGVAAGALFYTEFFITDRNTGGPMNLSGCSHEWRISLRGPSVDDWWNGAYRTIASDATGEVLYPAPGVLAVSIPASRFGWYWPDLRQQSIHFQFLAIPNGTGFTPLTSDSACLLAAGTITFGEREMPTRTRLDTYPLYPNALQMPVSQWLQALALVVPNGRAQLIAGVSPDPDNQNRIILEQTQTAPAGGAFENMAANVLGLSVAQIAQIRSLAVTLPV